MGRSIGPNAHWADSMAQWPNNYPVPCNYVGNVGNILTALLKYILYHRRVHPRDCEISQLASIYILNLPPYIHSWSVDGLQLDHPTYRGNTSIGYDKDASTNKVQFYSEK